MRTSDERVGGLQAGMLAAIQAMGFDIRVAIPGIVDSWDKDTQTVKVRPAIREILSNGGKETEQEIPLLVDVPVVFPCAGGADGYVMTITPAKGDECLVVFADMCIDAWWQSGGVQSQADKRRHDLSDGFAIIGVWNQTSKPPFPDKGCYIQNKKGTAGFSIVDDVVTVYGGTVNLQGKTVNVEGQLIINKQPYLSHTHYAPDGGGSTSGVQ